LRPVTEVVSNQVTPACRYPHSVRDANKRADLTLISLTENPKGTE